MSFTFCSQGSGAWSTQHPDSITIGSGGSLYYDYCDDDQFIYAIRVRYYTSSLNAVGDGCNNGINWVNFACKNPTTGATSNKYVPSSDLVSNVATTWDDGNTCSDDLDGTWSAWYNPSPTKYICPQIDYK
jgi:hypothetical protein